MIERLQRDRDEQGFTLVELLVVIFILAILAAVVVFAVGGIGDKGQGSACKIDTRTLRTAEEAYSTQNQGNYAAEPALVPGFLAEQSTLHNITLGDNPATLTVTERYYITVEPDAADPTSAKCGVPNAAVDGANNK